jgi:hypothetical protein
VAERVARRVAERIEEAFDTEGAAYGSPWAALQAATLARKQGRGQILVDQGDMKDALTDFRHPLFSLTHGQSGLSGSQMVIEVSDEKVIFHQLGTDRMPARPVWQVESGDPVAVDVARAEAEHIVELVNENRR